jgi:hypothetical protein
MLENEVIAAVHAGFGWWFTADKFGDAWSLGMLLKVLRLTKEIDGGMDVVKLLAELVWCPS